ncbi:MAG: hypothetical protein MI974_06030 [Chitinophagales bacterium]|nr:hypothetical protein [Chitinophagales bacterium]
MELQGAGFLPYLEEVELPSSDETFFEWAKSSPIKLNFGYPFSFVEIENNQGIWNPGSFFLNGWAFSVDPKLKRLHFSSDNEDQYFIYNIIDDTLKLIFNDGTYQSVMFIGHKIEEESRNEKLEFLASAPFQDRMELPSIRDSLLGKISFTIDKESLILFTRKYAKYENAHRWKRYKLISIRDQHLGLGGLSRLHRYAVKADKKIFIFSQREFLDDFITELKEAGFSQSENIFICYEDTLNTINSLHYIPLNQIINEE